MKKTFTAVCLTAMAAAALSAALAGCGEPENTATPDSASSETSATPDEITTAPESTEPSTGEDDKYEAMDFPDAFEDFPMHFVSHGGRPEDNGPSDYYYDAKIEFLGDGTMKGEFFTNLESTDSETIENKSNWTAYIRDGKAYKVSDNEYYFYVDGVRYEQEPETSEQTDGKTVKYVCGFGLDPEENNKLHLFTPEMNIDDLKNDESKMDMRQFLSMMLKDGEGETLGCYMLRGRSNDCYVSITDEEAKMEPPGQPPEQ